MTQPIDSSAGLSFAKGIFYALSLTTLFALAFGGLYSLNHPEMAVQTAQR